MAEQKEDNTRYIVRIAGRDLDGTKSIDRSLRAIKGVSHRMAQSIAIAFEKKSQVVYKTKLGELTDAQEKILEDVLANPTAHGIPEWIFNRQNDNSTGKSIHLVTNELEFAKRQDLQKLSEIKSYKGLRHGWGLTVRGQRTKSTHRRKGGVVGVMKKDAKLAAAKPASAAEKGGPAAGKQPEKAKASSSPAEKKK